MSTARDLAGAFMPHSISRRASAVLASVNAQLQIDLDGDNNAVVFIDGSGTFNATYAIEGTADGNTWFAVVAYPYALASVGGSPAPAQPLITEAVSAVTVDRLLCVPVGGLRGLRLRLTAYTGGTATVTINADATDSLSPYVRDQKSATLCVTNTAAAGTAVTLTLPAVTSLRHYLDAIRVRRSATAALTASATPVVVTTTNLPGAPALTFGSDAGGIGVDVEQVLDFGGAGLGASAAGTATTVVCPAWTGVIWRATAMYRLGL